MIGLSCGCGDRHLAQPSQEALQFATNDYHKQSSSHPKFNVPVDPMMDIYIDTSLSMKGYVVKNDPQEYTEFDKLLDSLGDSTPSARVHLYGQITGDSTGEHLTDPADFGRQIHNQDNYKRKFNPDDLLIERLLAESPPHLNILITDGVHSELDGKKNPPVVTAIEEWLLRGGTFGILVFKGRFSGALYSEQARRMITLKEPVLDRPFYAFVFSPRSLDYEQFATRLRQFAKPLYEFVFDDEALDIKAASVEGFDDVLYDDRISPPFRFQSLTRQAVNPDREAAELIHLDMPINKNYPVQYLQLTPEVARFDKEGSTFASASGVEKSIASICEDPKAAPTPGAQVPVYCVKLRFKNNPEVPFSLYRLKLRLSVRTLRPEILALSTRDDSQIEHANKTYLFYELLSALVNVHLNDEIGTKKLAPYYILVENAI
jgi:hypothetical protein